jgi:hypothetical protein
MRQPLDHLRSRKKPVWRKFPIVFDSQQAQEAQDAMINAVSKRNAADLRPGDQRLLTIAEEAEEEAERLRAAVLENSAWFIARSLGPDAYEELQHKHPPTEAQRKEARKEGVQGNLAWNPDTFPRALIPLCVWTIVYDEETGEEVEEQLTEEYVKEMYEGTDWNMAECNAVLQAAIDVNQTRRVVDAGNGFGQMRRS